MMDKNSDSQCIGIVGAGSIGLAWAVVFATGGYRVRLFDPDRHRLEVARQELSDRVTDLNKCGLIDVDLNDILASVSMETDIEKNVIDVVHVQECIPEIKEEKEKLFSLLGEMVPAHVPIASSTSFLPMSTLAATIKNRERYLVIHPGNAPYLLRIAEIVPAPFTSDDAIRTSVELMVSVGMNPIVLRKETTGFVFNRLQGALLNEAYSLVQDGVVSAEDIDTIVKDLEAKGEKVQRDAFGHVKLDFINPGEWYAERFTELLRAEKTLVQKSGYFARSAAPNERDLDLITRSANLAAECGVNGKGGVVGLDQDNKDKLTLIDFSRIKGGKPFDINEIWFGDMLREIGQPEGKKL